MALLVPNIGEVDMLSYALNKGTPENVVLKLYKNDVTPSETDTDLTYTEADFTGYSSATLTGASWTVTSAGGGGGEALAEYAQQSFTSSANQSAQSIYGYFTVRATSGNLSWAERFTNGPYTIANNGDSIKVTPKITLD